MLSMILLVFALVLFILAGALNTPWQSRLISFGLACWVGSELLRGAGPTVH